MKIEKVNDHQIRCTLTREDLVSRELKISELAYGTDKAKDLFRDMMQQAALEFDFDAEDIPLMIEAIPLNSDCIVLIVTKVEDPEELDTRFAKFAPSVQEDEDSDLSDESAELSALSEDVINLFEKISKATPEKHKDPTTQTASSSGPTRSGQDVCRVFAFRSLSDITSLARILGTELDCTNSLYKDKEHNRYLLVVRQEHLSTSAFGKVCNTISEYGNSLKTATTGNAYMDEHFTLLAEQQALQLLSEI